MLLAPLLTGIKLLLTGKQPGKDFLLHHQLSLLPLPTKRVIFAIN